MSRQYQSALATDFLKMSESERTIFLDGVADDIEGMIERRRRLSANIEPRVPLSLSSRVPRKSGTQAYNFDEVDFVEGAEVALSDGGEQGRSVYAQIDFVERLYVQGENGRIEFGIKRAYLSVYNNGPGELSRVDHLRSESSKQNASYKALWDAPYAITVCMDAISPKGTLAELALPPSRNENYLSQIATATADVETDQLEAELTVSLNVEGVHIYGELNRRQAPKTMKSIAAIMNVAMSKAATRDSGPTRDGKLRRKLLVRDRS
jgi:hypothetical protein